MGLVLLMTRFRALVSGLLVVLEGGVSVGLDKPFFSHRWVAIGAGSLETTMVVADPGVVIPSSSSRSPSSSKITGNIGYYQFQGPSIKGQRRALIFLPHTSYRHSDTSALSPAVPLTASRDPKATLKEK